MGQAVNRTGLETTHAMCLHLTEGARADVAVFFSTGMAHPSSHHQIRLLMCFQMPQVHMGVVPLKGVEWFKVEWPEDWLEVDISAKELVPVVVAAAVWGRLWAGKHICFHSDNMAVVAIFNSRTAKDPILMHLLRCFPFTVCTFSSIFQQNIFLV